MPGVSGRTSPTTTENWSSRIASLKSPPESNHSAQGPRSSGTSPRRTSHPTGEQVPAPCGCVNPAGAGHRCWRRRRRRGTARDPPLHGLPRSFPPEEATMLVSMVYLALRRVFELALLRWPSREFKELEIVVLRHELAILRRRHGGPRLDAADRVFLAAASRLLAGAPELLPRHARHAPAGPASWSRGTGRMRGAAPAAPRSATSSERWCAGSRARTSAGYRRIAGELVGLGVSVSPASSWAKAGLGRAGARGGLSWREFLRRQAPPATSSPSRPSPCGGSACSSSSSSDLGACPWPARPRTPVVPGSPSGRATWRGRYRSQRLRPAT
jgi:hypothetical protein